MDASLCGCIITDTHRTVVVIPQNICFLNTKYASALHLITTRVLFNTYRMLFTYMINGIGIVLRRERKCRVSVVIMMRLAILHLQIVTRVKVDSRLVSVYL